MLLTAIVPVTKMAGKLQHFEEWLSICRGLPIEIIVCHDVQDDQTGPELTKIFESLNLENKLIFLEGAYDSPGLARNAGIPLASGEWIVFWDSDDLPDVKKAVQLIDANRHSSDILVTRFRQVNLSSKTHQVSAKFSRRRKKNLSILASEIGIWRNYFKSVVVQDKHFEKFKMGEDAVFLAEMEDYFNNATFINEITYNYYIGIENQATSSNLARRENSHASHALTNLPTGIFRDLLSAKLRISTALASNNLKDILRICFGTLIKRRLSGLFFLLILTRKRVLWSSRIVLPRAGVSIVGGFGNQLFQVAALLSLRDFPEEPMLIEWGLGSVRLDSNQVPAISELNLGNRFVFHKNSVLSKFTSKCIGFSRKIQKRKTKSLLGKLYESAIFFITRLVVIFYFKSCRHISIYDEIGYNEISKFENDFLLTGYFQSYKYLDEPNVRFAMKSILEPKLCSDYLHYVELSKVEQPVILHIRLGDYRFEDKFGIIDSHYILEALSRIPNSQYRKIWLFSDEILEAKHLLPSSLHEQLRVIDIEDTIFSFQVMRLGHDYVISNSTFSWWAAAMTLNQNARVCVPNPWFKALEPPSDMIPEGWIKVDAWK